MTHDFLGVGWKFPIALDDGRFALSRHEQRIEESIRLILTTRIGERVMRPDFGCRVHELVYELNVESVRVLAENFCRDALERWEPRIEVLRVQSSVNPSRPHVLNVDVKYEVRSTNNEYNLVFPFSLQTGAES